MADKSKTDKANKPAHTLRDGAIEVAIWKNEGSKGPFFTVTHRRSYKQGDEWKESDQYAKDDLLPLAKLLDLAHTWMLTQQQQQRSKQAA